MTFRDLQKIVQQSQSGPEQFHLLQKLRGKPFWIWSETEHKVKDCCFNHIIDLPRKDGIEKSIFDYEEVFTIFFLYQSFFTLQDTRIEMMEVQ